MRLFARLYLDEDVDVLAARLLESRGFSAVTTQEAGCIGQTDREQLSYAVEHERALLTHNRADFEALASSTSARTARTTGSFSPTGAPLINSRNASFDSLTT